MVNRKVFALSLRRVTALGALWASKGTISGLELCWNNSQKSLHRLATSPTAASAWPVIATLPPFPLFIPCATKPSASTSLTTPHGFIAPKDFAVDSKIECLGVLK